MIVNNRLGEALEMRGMKQVELAERTGYKKASINSWVKQRWQPKQDAIYSMAKVLEVNEMWLAGYDVQMERSEARIKMDELGNAINLVKNDKRISKIVINLCKLSESQLTMVENIVFELSKTNS